MTGLFAVIFKQQDRKAVEALQNEVARTANSAIRNANALQETIRGMIERKQQNDESAINATIKKH